MLSSASHALFPARTRHPVFLPTTIPLSTISLSPLHHPSLSAISGSSGIAFPPSPPPLLAVGRALSAPPPHAGVFLALFAAGFPPADGPAASTAAASSNSSFSRFALVRTSSAWSRYFPLASKTRFPPPFVVANA